MNITLIRDKIPKLAEASSIDINYATLNSENLRRSYLIQKLAEVTNDYLSSLNSERLIEIRLIIDTLWKTSTENGKTFDEMYDESIKTYGSYENGYIMFYNDSPQPEVNE